MSVLRSIAPRSYFKSLTRLKKLVWLYLLLLIFEGALRKWIVPQLSAPLLVVRDPVGLMILWEAYRTVKWPARWSGIIAFLCVAFVALFTIQTVFGGNLLIIGLYGLRSYLLPYPVMFVIGENLDREDLYAMGRLLLWLLPPMAVLEAAQYHSAPGSFLNKGAYEGGAQIGYVLDHVRASGTFSFAVGAVAFGVLTAAFIVYGITRDGFASKRLLWAALFGLFLSVPMAGARSYLFLLVAMVGCMALGAAMGVSHLTKALRLLVPAALVLLLVSFLPVFSNAMGSFNQRLQSKAEGGVENALYTRAVAPVLATFENLGGMSSAIGDGIGRGAKAMQALEFDRTQMVLGETIIERETREMGWIVGGGYAIFKILLGIAIFAMALDRGRNGDTLALLLCSFAIDSLWFSSPEQASEQGFMIVSVAFCIAAAKMPVVRAQSLTYPLALQRQRVLAQRRARQAALASRDRNAES